MLVAILKPESKNRDGRDWESVRLASVSRRRWRWAVAGAVLIAGGAAAGATSAAWGEDTVRVAVAVQGVEAGHVLTEADLGVVEVPAGAAGELAGLGEAIGGVAAVPLAEGTPVSRAALAEEAAWPAPGEAVVAVELPAGALPEAATPGAQVEVFTGSVAGGGDGEEASPAGGLAARVHAVRESEELGGAASVVELELAAQDAALVARSPAEEVRVVLVNAEAGDGGGAGAAEAEEE